MSWMTTSWMTTSEPLWFMSLGAFCSAMNGAIAGSWIVGAITATREPRSLRIGAFAMGIEQLAVAGILAWQTWLLASS